MRASIINKSPSDWLREIGEPAARIREVLSSFKPDASLKVCVYRAEHVFFRFHGTNSARDIYEPNYWADWSLLGNAFDHAGQFEGWLPDERIRIIAKRYYRELSAICHNWNALEDSKLWKIELREGETVEGLEGPAAPQPTHAADKNTPASRSRLRGGGLQVYLNPRTPFICTPIDWATF